MDYPTEGGSYTRDPKTGRLTLVHRTEGNAVWAEGGTVRAEPSLAGEQGPEAVAAPATNPTATKPEKA